MFSSIQSTGLKERFCRPGRGWPLATLSLAAGAILLLGAGCAGKGPSEVAVALPEIQLSAEEAQQWAAFLQPTAVESLWDSVDWRMSIWEAVLEGIDTGRPLLLFSMNGHPKGFT